MDKPLDELIGRLYIDAAKKSCQSKQYKQAETMLEKLLKHTDDKKEALEIAFDLRLAGNMAISKSAWTEAIVFLKAAKSFIEFARGKNDLEVASLMTARPIA